jgi:hypothetical protein
MVEYQKELEHAISARSKGNEGMARVCARRAAGFIIGAYLNRRGYSGLTKSAYDNISVFTTLPIVDQKYKDIASHFLLKVNHDHKLPLAADLINDVLWLESNLLKDNID